MSQGIGSSRTHWRGSGSFVVPDGPLGVGLSWHYAGMAEEPEKSGQEPNLELPSLLGFGRKMKRRRDAPAPQDTDPLAADPVAPPRGGLAPATAKARRPPPTPPPGARRPPTRPPAEPPPTRPLDDQSDHIEESEELETATAPEPADEDLPVLPVGRFTSPPSVEPSSPEPATTGRSAPQGHGDQSQLLEEPPTGPAGATDQRPAASATWLGAVSVALPVINPRIATVVTGALVGLIGVVLAYLTGRGCEQVRGVASCGGLGLFALLVILAVMVALGAAMLKAWRVYDPVSTSFLGVGLIAVVVLLFLLSSLESVWMLLVIPVLSGFTFLLSRWVTETLIEDSSGTR